MNAATKLQALERELEQAAQNSFGLALDILGRTDPLKQFPELGVNNYCPACDEVMTLADDVFAGACKSCRLDELRADYHNTCMEDAQ